MGSRILLVAVALVATLAVPFLLRPEGEAPASALPAADVITVITPHNETIQKVFGEGFRDFMRREHDREVAVEWRSLGGTSEIEKFLDTSFAFAFRRHWTQGLGRPWSEAEIGSRFQDRRLELPADPASDDPAQSARRAFLASRVGIGIDLFFGGGPYPFVVQAGQGHLVDCGVGRRHPEWFREEVIPATFSGETYHDPEFRWVGACLSSFGIIYNRDSLARLGVAMDDLRWWDMGRPELFQQVALADPSKSGSVTKAFEMLLQQTMREAFEEADGPPGDEARLAAGWDEGMRLIQRICANARYFSSKSPEIALDVSQGNAAMGMCIDFFGRTYDERYRRGEGEPRVSYVTPEGGSSVSIDPIALLRGAPNPELAGRFIDFLLSPEGQRLWNYRPGTPGGPRTTALRRLPVRRDLYVPSELAFFSDPAEMPYERGRAFAYEPAWTAAAFGAIRFVLRAGMIDAHSELRAAWAALIEHDFPPEARALFDDVSRIGYAESLGPINEVLRRDDPVAELRLGRELTAGFRERYRRVAALARERSR